MHEEVAKVQMEHVLQLSIPFHGPFAYVSYWDEWFSFHDNRT